MNKQIPIILASHGAFAKGVLNCAEMLVGKQDNIYVISVELDSNIDEIEAEFFRTYDQCDTSNGMLILVDIMGGTPSNLASKLALSKNNILVYGGINIPILLEILSDRTLSLTEIANQIDEISSDTFINVTNLLNQTHPNTITNIDEL